MWFCSLGLGSRKIHVHCANMHLLGQSILDDNHRYCESVINSNFCHREIGIRHVDQMAIGLVGQPGLGYICCSRLCHHDLNKQQRQKVFSVCLSIHPCAHPSIHLHIYLSIYPSIHLSIHPSSYLSIYLSSSTMMSIL